MFRNVCTYIQFLSSLFQIHSGFPPFLLALPRPGRGVIEVLVVFLSKSCIRITSAEVDVGGGPVRRDGTVDPPLWRVCGHLNPRIFVASWKRQPLAFSIPHLSLVMGQTLGWESGGSQIHLVRSVPVLEAMN